MTDYSVDVPRGRTRRPNRAEYAVYFALVFAIALPFALVAWSLSPVLGGRTGAAGPLTRALSEARAAATMIFRA